MFSLMDIKCPHCGAEGQIVTPPFGSVVIGPCPNCHNPVLLFCGKTLALDKQVVAESSLDGVKEHLIEVMCQCVRQMADQLVEQATDQPSSQPAIDTCEKIKSMKPTPSVTNSDAPAITSRDIKDFVKIDLNLLDKREHFDRLFGEMRNRNESRESTSSS